MTVPVQTPSRSYTEDGVSTDFPVPFRYRDPADLRALRRDSAGTETVLVNGTDFSATVGDSEAGGTLTVTAAAASGTLLTIWRDTARAQQTDYSESGAFPAETHEGALDRAMLIAQEQDAERGRAVLAPRGEAGFQLRPRSEIEGKTLTVADDEIVGVESDPAEVASAARRASGDASTARSALAAAQALFLATASLAAAASNPGPDALTLAAAIDAAREVMAPLAGSAVPTYLTSIIREVRVNNGVPGRQYIPRFVLDSAGAGGTKRFIMQCYDPVIGEPVAYMALAEASGWDGIVPRSLTCWGASAGSRLNNSAIAKFHGLSMTVWFNTAAFDFATPFNNFATTDPAALAINPDRVETREQAARRILGLDPVEEEVITWGDLADGADYATLQAALASVLRPGTVGRGQFPYTFRCSASHQIRFKGITPGHTEEWLENVVDQGGSTFLAQGMLTQMGMVIEFPERAVIWTEGGKNASGYSGPLFEVGYGGVMLLPLSARLEQRGNGYVRHSDVGNAISHRAIVGEAVQFFQIVRKLEGGTLWAHAGHTDWIEGRGISNDEIEVYRPGRVVREAGATATDAFYGCHTSPEVAGDGVRAGHIYFDLAAFNDNDTPGPAIAFTTLGSDVAQVVTHQVSLGNTRCAEVTGTDKYRLIGAVPSGATVSAAMLA